MPKPPPRTRTAPTSTAITPHAEGAGALTVPRELAEAVAGFARDAKAKATRRAYRADWQRFAAWCAELGAEPLPASPELVALYLAHRAELGRKVSTIKRELVALSQAHQAAGHESPTSAALVREALKGLTRARARQGEQVKRAPALSPAHLSAMMRALGEDLRGLRDRALLLLGFAGAFRRGELVALHVEDLAFEPEGLRVTLRRSKTDQEGQGRTFGIRLATDPERCPVRAARAWLDASGIEAGPLFREITPKGELGPRQSIGRTVDRALKRAASRAQLPLEVSAHSLRAGFITSARRAGKRPERIRAISGHKDGSRVFEGYIREADIWRDNATDGVL